MKMAIIGHGFVGKAVDAGFNDPRIEKYIIDPALYGTELKNLNKDIELACVCLPTPMNDDGTINADLVLEATQWLHHNTDALIVIKSTITPDVLPKYGNIDLRKGVKLVYNPEFLAERNEILKHKWLESEKVGNDIGFEKALLDWIQKHRSNWRNFRKNKK